MADINENLLKTPDDIPAPQHKKKGERKFEFTEGSNGAQHVKIVDSSGEAISKINVNDSNATGLLEYMKEFMEEQTTRGYAGYSDDDKPEGRVGDSFLELDTKYVFVYDGDEWVKL